MRSSPAICPLILTVTRAYLPIHLHLTDGCATKKTISDTLQAGVWLVQYTGHGAPQFLGQRNGY